MTKVSQILNIVLILGLVAGTFCYDFELIEKLNSIRSKDRSVNKTISTSYVNAIQLQLQGEQSIGVVIDMVKDLIKDLDDQIEAATQDWVSKNTEWDSEIDNYEKTIVNLKYKIIQLDDLIIGVSATIKTLERSIKINKVQIQLGFEKQNALKTARENDIKNYKSRTERQKSMLEAVNYIINELNASVDKGQFLQIQQIIDKYPKIKPADFNKIQAFVDLTLTFNVESVQYCVKQLTKIRDSLDASLDDEESQELAAQFQFKIINKELSQFLDDKEVEQNQNQELLKIAQGKLLDYQKDKASAEELLELNIKLLDSTQKEQNLYNLDYKEEQKVRQYEVQVLDDVVTILSANQQNIDKSFTLSFSQKAKY